MNGRLAAVDLLVPGMRAYVLAQPATDAEMIVRYQDFHVSTLTR